MSKWNAQHFISPPLFALFGLLMPNTAFAYIPHGTYLVAKLAEKRAALTVNDLEALLETTYAERGPDEVNEKLQLKRGGKLRLTRTEGESESVSILKDGKRTEVSATGDVKPGTPGFEPLTDLFYPKVANVESARSEMIGLLQKLGVDLTIDTMQRAGNKIAYVYGAKAGELEKPQIWLDKDNLLPLRIIYKEGDKLWDVSFSEWGIAGGADVFPRLIRRSLNGKVFSESTVEKLATNQKLAESLFNPPTQKK